MGVFSMKDGTIKRHFHTRYHHEYKCRWTILRPGTLEINEYMVVL
jgi:hypothetical protein